jgi:hypothetical protein
VIIHHARPALYELFLFHILRSFEAMSPEPTTAEKIAFRRKTIRTMKDELDQTLSAVQSGNYDSAYATFEHARKKWNTFGGTIKRLSAPTYTPMDAAFRTIDASLRQAQPPQATLVGDLQALIHEAASAVTISDAND